MNNEQNLNTAEKQQLNIAGVSGSVFLQIGMDVKIINDKINFPCDAGKILKITNHLKEFQGTRAFELDNRKGDIFLIEDFEYCVNYPHLSMR